MATSPSPFACMSAGDLVQGFARREFSPVEVMRAALDRADAVQQRYNAFVLIDDARALAMASASEQRWLRAAPLGLLDGVPVAVKDTTNVQGWPTRYGSQAGQTAGDAEDDSPLVQRMREHGAAFIGKTAAPEFAWKGITDSALHGVTRNPWNPAKTPGGSSGGSAVAVATGVVPLATAPDGGGSIRIPASFTGTYGLKPTAGLIPNIPSPLGSLAVVGGITRSVHDMARFLRVVVAPDPRDSFAPPVPALPSDLLERSGSDLRGLRIGMAADLGFDPPTPDVARALEETVRHLRELGAQVTPTTLKAADTLEAFETLWAVGFHEILARLSDEGRSTVEPALRDFAASAAHISGLKVQAATRMARVFSARMATFFNGHDLLLTPTVPVPPLDAGQLLSPQRAGPHWWNWTPMTWPFNVSRNPAASCPAGMTRDGLPIGMQLVGKWFDEATVLKVSHVLERFHPRPYALSDTDVATLP
jgi:aspartyl-tRNA(Asn)/glutamyl-tRNA(Gln) amidotransferase subunit A